MCWLKIQKVWTNTFCITLLYVSNTDICIQTEYTPQPMIL